MAVGTRAAVQVLLTAFTLVTAITAFAFAFFFEQYMSALYQNMRGETTEAEGGQTFLPCVRATLDVCSNTDHDKCFIGCCPAGYQCLISPVVGLYCQHDTTTCGNRKWCLEFADILETCSTDTCRFHRMVGRATTFSYIIAALGIFLDLSDVITFLCRPDSIVCKSSINVLSSIVKWIAFGSALGAGTATFLSNLEAASCFNQDGVEQVGAASSMFLLFATLQVVSAILSLALAPFSAYWGGKLIGVPYVK